MYHELQLLVELQTIDRQILSLQNKIQNIPSRIKSVEQPMIDAQSNLTLYKKRYEDFLKKRKDKEYQLDDISEKIEKVKGRASEIKTNKEYQAHLKEIESIEDERITIEDQILVLMEQSDDMAMELKNLENKVKEEEQKLTEFKESLNQESREIDRELTAVRLKRGDISEKITKEVYEAYMKQLEEKQGLAVVEVKDEICQGCNMNIPPQLYVEVRKGDELHTCPQCSRYLYYPSQTEGS